MHGAPRALALDKRHGYEQSRDSHERDSRFLAARGLMLGSLLDRLFCSRRL